MTAITLPFAAKSAAKPKPAASFDIGPVTRTMVSLATFTMTFAVIVALGKAALGMVDNLHLYAKLPIIIHVAAVLPTIPLGGWLLLAKKGTALHKQLGKLWLVLMLITATTAIFIQTSGSFSPIHLFVHMRGAYRISILGTLIRMVLLFVGSCIAVGFLLAGLVMVGLATAH